MHKIHAPAKINLGLHVLRRRSDGYHDVETVLLRVPWRDELSVERSDRLTFTCSDPGLPTDAGILCMRAAILLKKVADVSQGAALPLEKRIPYGAGLGGGSSDAAGTLGLLTDYWELDVSCETIYELATELGADVPFFIEGEEGTLASYATGRGDVPAPMVEYEFPYSLVVVAPPVEISTEAAYRLVKPREAPRPSLPDVVRSNDLAVWREKLVNDFQAPIFAAYPAVERACTALGDAGAGYTSLSGSGSAVYGCFTDDSEARAAAESARRNGLRVWSGRVE